MRILPTFALALSVLISATLVAPHSEQNIPQEHTYIVETAQELHNEKTTTEEIKPPTLTGELRRICACESQGRPDATPTHFAPDGTVLRGRVNPLDIGICQINLTYHGDAARDLGFDLFTEAGNIGYAHWLYTRQGAHPWSWSNACHHALDR